MSTFLIFGLILISIFFIIIELLIIPGISIAGVLSIIFFTLGIILSYKYYGSQIGNIILLISLIVIAIVIIQAFKPNTWKKLSLSAQISSKSKTTDQTKLLKVGDHGKTKSKLSPIGEIEINGNRYEASSIGEYIEQYQPIEIIKIDGIKYL